MTEQRKEQTTELVRDGRSVTEMAEEVSAAAMRAQARTRRNRKTTEHIDRDIRQLKYQRNKLLRKERTRRLIQAGGIIERELGRPLEDEDLERLARFLIAQERNGAYFSRAMNAGREV